jgi:hypothetical protein
LWNTFYPFDVSTTLSCSSGKSPISCKYLI